MVYGEDLIKDCGSVEESPAVPDVADAHEDAQERVCEGPDGGEGGRGDEEMCIFK